MRRSLIVAAAFWSGVFCLTLGVPDVLAQVMQSSNYQIQSDSVNVGGGYSTSASYQLESTAGEVGTGDLNSSNYNLRAGYQQMQEVYIAMTAPSDVTMSPALPGLSGGTSTGLTSVVVTTDSLAGYQLTIEAENSPAMQSGANTISDYSASGDPDYNFTYSVSEAVFGFSPEGVDVVQRFLDNGSDTCNTSSSETTAKCWDGLSTSTQTIAGGSTSNHPNGATTSVRFQVGVGSSAGKEVGSYVATTTITALAL